MKCIHCDTEMITANMDTGITVGSYFYNNVRENPFR